MRCGLRISLVVFPRIRVFNGRFIGLVYRFFEASDCFTKRFAQSLNAPIRAASVKLSLLATSPRSR